MDVKNILDCGFWIANFNPQLAIRISQLLLKNHGRN